MPRLRIATFCAVMATLLLTSCTPGGAQDSQSLRPVEVDKVVQQGRGFIVFMREIGGKGRVLPITIGSGQAQSISLALREVEMQRPNTHDLIKSMLDGVASELERVVITELRGNIYYARIELRISGRRVEIDARPSDAIAVALRTGAPVFVNPALFKTDSERMEADNPLRDCPTDPASQSKDQPVV